MTTGRPLARISLQIVVSTLSSPPGASPKLISSRTAQAIQRSSVTLATAAKSPWKLSATPSLVFSTLLGARRRPVTRLNEEAREAVEQRRDQRRGRDGDDPGDEDAAGDAPAHGGDAPRRADADDRPGDGVRRRDRHAELGREEQRDGAAGLGAEALHRRQAGDLRAHRL